MLFLAVSKGVSHLLDILHQHHTVHKSEQPSEQGELRVPGHSRGGHCWPCTCAARPSSHLRTVIIPAQEIQEASQRTGGKKTSNPWQSQLGSGAGRSFARAREEGRMLLVRHLLGQELQRIRCSPASPAFPASPASPAQDPTPAHSRAVPVFLNHCAPARVGLGTGHATLQLLEVGVQSYGQPLDKTPLDFRKGLFLGKECSTGHLLVLCVCASQTRLSTADFWVARSTEIHAFPCISHSFWVFLKATNRGNIKGSLSPWSFIAVAGLGVRSYVLWFSSNWVSKI